MKKVLKTGVIVCLTAICAAVLIKSEIIVTTVRSSLSTCLVTVIPSFYLFTVICMFAVKSEIFEEAKRVNLLLSKIIGVPYCAVSIIILSFFCGYPIGAKLLNEQYKKGNLSQKAAASLLPVCTNPSPAFAVSVVGKCVFNNANIGIIIYVASIISALIFTLTVKKDDTAPLYRESNKQIRYCASFFDAIKETNYAVLYICSWIIIANCTAAICAFLPTYVSALFEVTSGVINYGVRYGVYFAAFSVGFGGISVIFQIVTCAAEIRPKILYTAATQFLKGISVVVNTYLLLKIFPQEISVATVEKVAVISEGSTVFVSLSVFAFIITTLAFIQKKLKKS